MSLPKIDNIPVPCFDSVPVPSANGSAIEFPKGTDPAKVKKNCADCLLLQASKVVGFFPTILECPLASNDCGKFEMINGVLTYVVGSSHKA